MARWRDEELSADLLEQAIRSGCYRVGIEELKSEQQKAVQALLRGDNVFITLPTGDTPVCVVVGGKSASREHT